MIYAQWLEADQASSGRSCGTSLLQIVLRFWYFSGFGRSHQRSMELMYSQNGQTSLAGVWPVVHSYALLSMQYIFWYSKQKAFLCRDSGMPRSRVQSGVQPWMWTGRQLATLCCTIKPHQTMKLTRMFVSTQINFSIVRTQCVLVPYVGHRSRSTTNLKITKTWFLTFVCKQSSVLGHILWSWSIIRCSCNTCTNTSCLNLFR